MKNFGIFALGMVAGALLVKGYQAYKLHKEMMTTEQGNDISSDPVANKEESYPVEEAAEKLEQEAAKKLAEEMNKKIIESEGYVVDAVEDEEEIDHSLPYEISEHEYGGETDDAEYEPFEWSFWQDDIVTGEDDCVLGANEVRNTIGQEAVDKLRSGLDEIYIRNELICCDYHIVRESVTYAERYKV